MSYSTCDFLMCVYELFSFCGCCRAWRNRFSLTKASDKSGVNKLSIPTCHCFKCHGGDHSKQSNFYTPKSRTNQMFPLKMASNPCKPGHGLRFGFPGARPQAPTSDMEESGKSLEESGRVWKSLEELVLMWSNHVEPCKTKNKAAKYKRVLWNASDLRFDLPLLPQNSPQTSDTNVDPTWKIQHDVPTVWLHRQPEHPVLLYFQSDPWLDFNKTLRRC